MSDRQPTHPLTGAELSARLHGLAAHHAALAPTTGAQVRNRAVRRRRTRHAALAVTTLAAALIAVTTGALDALGALGSSAGPTAPPAASASHNPTPDPSSMPVQQVTVDLNSESLSVGGRRYAIAGPKDTCPIGETSVTVTAKYPTLTMPSTAGGKGGAADVRRWAVTFTDRSHHERLLRWVTDDESFALGYHTNPGAIGLGPGNGKEAYDAIRPGARVKIKGWQAPDAQPDSACPDRRPITSDR
ncbi:hypothetical protein [Streptomyces sp. NPDC086787]|uniref:hypothetical protein n=1 Tax=Streptomyces sp. NPDC086787 TaxID=3365759 RepID=UPI00382EEA74